MSDADWNDEVDAFGVAYSSALRRHVIAVETHAEFRHEELILKGWRAELDDRFQASSCEYRAASAGTHTSQS